MEYANIGFDTTLHNKDNKGKQNSNEEDFHQDWECEVVIIF